MSSYIKYAVLIFLLILFILLNNYTSLRITDLEKKDVNIEKLSLPFVDYPKGPAGYVIAGKIHSGKISQKTIRIIPDNGVEYITVNGCRVSFDNIDIRSLSDHEKGFALDLEPYIHQGENNFEIKIYSSNGYISLKITNSFSDRIYLFLSISIILLAAILFYYILRELKLDKITCVIMACSLIVSIIYLTNTDYTERSYDVEGHLEYIQYVEKNYSLPKPDSGWENFQAPLYYITGAIVYKLAGMAGLPETQALQVLTLIYFQIFLIFGIFIFKKIKFFSEESQDLYYLAVSLMVFWPSGIIHSVRITNDIMYYMFYTAGLYFLIKWYDEEKYRFLYGSAICTFLGILTKFNCVFMGSIIGISIIYKLMKEKDKKKYVKHIIIIAIIILSGILVIFIRNVNYIKYNNEWISVNVGELPPGLSIENKASNFLYFDIKNFINEPFTSCWEDKQGRQIFWNYLFKTGLFGEFNFPSTFHTNSGIIISFLFIIMLFFFITGL
ncbi:MAG: phospholipid carrier-dependent glycosyltransferase, partial [Candidatus Eremiobacterota bacterium]